MTDPSPTAPQWERVLARLVETRGDALVRYAAFVCGSSTDAADLVQDALVRTFGRLRNGYTVDNAEAYVRRAIVSLHIDRVRRRTTWRRIAHLTWRPEEVESPDADTERRLDLHGELRKLSPRERACLVLRYYDDLPVAQIAATLEISPGTVKRYLSDGLAKMALALGREPDAVITPIAEAPSARPGSADAPTRSKGVDRA
ncbi:sigma-70 family RNA polymerase sigma factor [Galbitalea sp. SE-J8]|uniref:sigma-70 family RNA polymerase sigma factor n=1 Tax=Galbitalea sp. SE-J8 TaxID=3054952 RepID=UPI00259D0C21|nr:sigma-70 family RNA polymerase sigma factor [Galbitalea sp. SE-J8]MDM4764177.1 sigma-70 family RNA polymerase sigma factor [Galbitalea sp. SE-J8]